VWGARPEKKNVWGGVRRKGGGAEQ